MRNNNFKRVFIGIMVLVVLLTCFIANSINSKASGWGDYVSDLTFDKNLYYDFNDISKYAYDIGPHTGGSIGKYSYKIYKFVLTRDSIINFKFEFNNSKDAYYKFKISYYDKDGKPDGGGYDTDAELDTKTGKYIYYTNNYGIREKGTYYVEIAVNENLYNSSRTPLSNDLLPAEEFSVIFTCEPVLTQQQKYKVELLSKYKPVIKQKNSSKNSISFKLKKKSAVANSKYEIQYKKRMADTWESKTVSSVNKLKITKLKKNTKYDFRVRSFITIDGEKYYSKWSKVFSIKTKK